MLRMIKRKMEMFKPWSTGAESVKNWCKYNEGKFIVFAIIAMSAVLVAELIYLG